MIELYGMTWDHPRGFDSIVAATEEYHKQADDCRITWHKRSLKDFGDFPIELLIEKYDLIMIDHPFVGEARAKNLLQPTEAVLPAEFINSHSQAHIEPTFESYSYGGAQWALPIDAATQVSAYNPKLLSQSSLPNNWSEYTGMMDSASFRTKVLWPLCETDAWCSFLTIAAQLGDVQNKPVFLPDGLNGDLAMEALEMLGQLTKYISIDCWSMNPIDAMELMSRKESQYVFSPLLFGYCNYSRSGRTEPITFSNALSIRKEKPLALLGGVGVAISIKSDHLKEISDFLQFILQDKIMTGAYFQAGGQPSIKSAWNSKDVNSEVSGFFTNTLKSMKNAFVRPRVSGFNYFQEKAAREIHSKMSKKKRLKPQILGSINEIYRDCCLT